jgi:hypothetical protein
MNTSTSRGHCPAFTWLAGAGLFREFQYLTVPLEAAPGLLALAAARLEAPAQEGTTR